MGIQTTNMEVLIKLTDQFSGPLASISKSLTGLNTSVLGISKNFLSMTAAIAAVTLAAKQAMDAADSLVKLAAQTGINTTNLQKLGIAADAAGTNMNSLVTAFRMMSTHAEQAAEGNKNAVDMFRQLGISITDANGSIKNGQTLFMEFADQISKTNNSTLVMAETVRVLGRGGTELIPVLKEGSGGIKAIGDAAETVGLIMGQHTVENLALFNRALGLVSTGFQTMVAEMLSMAIDKIPKLVDIFQQAVPQIAKAWSVAQLAATIFWQTITVISTAVGTTLGRVVESLKIVMAEAIKAVAPLFDVIIAVANKVDPVWGQMLENVRGKLASFVDSQENKSFAQIWSNFPDTIKTSFDTAQQTVTDAIAKLDQSEDDAEKGMRDKLNAVKVLIGQYADVVAKSNQQVGNSFGQVNRDAFDFFKGFGLAVQDFNKNLGNWEIAWSGLFKSLESGISTDLDNFITKTHSVSQLMNDLFTTIEKSFVHMLTTMATQQILGGIMGQIFTGNNNTATSASTNSAMGSVMGALGGVGGGFSAANQLNLGALTRAAGQQSNPTAGGSPAAATTAASGSGGLFGTSLGGDLTLGGLLGGLGLTAAGAAEYQSATQQGSVNVTHATVGGALSGAATGAMIGSVIPGIGTLIGGAVGLVGGAIAGFFGGSSAKQKQQKAEQEAAAAQAAAEAAARAQAKQLLIADVRAKYGGGLADTSVMPDIGNMLSNGMTDAELDKIGNASDIAAQGGAIASQVSNISVGSPQITVNAQVAGSYDVQRLAEDLGLQLSSSIRSAASGAGP